MNFDFIISAIIYSFFFFNNMNIFTHINKYTNVQTNKLKLASPSYTNTAETIYLNQNRMGDSGMGQKERDGAQRSKQRKQAIKKRSTNVQEVKQQPQSPCVVIDNVEWTDTQKKFSSDMELKVQYLVTKQLEEDICWRIVYLGSAFSENYDQILCQFQTTESQQSSSYPQKRQFKLTVQPPKPNLIQQQELFNVTAIIICAYYKGQEFVKFGYYVHYQLPLLSKAEKQQLQKFSSAKKASKKQDNQKNLFRTKKIHKQCQKSSSSRSNNLNREKSETILQQILSRTIRTILVDKPRITKFNINWQPCQQSKQNIQKSQLQTFSQDQISSNQLLITKYLHKHSTSGMQLQSN